MTEKMETEAADQAFFSSTEKRNNCWMKEGGDHQEGAERSDQTLAWSVMHLKIMFENNCY